MKEWTNDGIEVDVICAPSPGSPSFEVIDLANIYRIEPWGYKENTTGAINEEENETRLKNAESAVASHRKTGFREIDPDQAETNVHHQDLAEGILQEGSNNAQMKHSVTEQSVIELDNHSQELKVVEERETQEDKASNRGRVIGANLYFFIRRILKWSLTIIRKAHRYLFHLIKVVWHFLLRSIRKIRRSANNLLIRLFRFFLRNARQLYYLFVRLRRILFRAFKRLQLHLARSYTRISRKFYGTFMWPDYGMKWIIPAYQQAKKLIATNSYDSVITVSWPVSPHVVGYLLKSELRKKNIRWIVDIGDPFSYNTLTQINNFDLYGKFNKVFEQKLIEKSNLVTVTTNQTKDQYCQYFTVSEDRIRVIPPIVTLNQVTSSGNPSFFPKSADKLRLIYSGSLRRLNRRPDSLLKLFAGLCQGDLGERLELHFFGDIKQCKESFQAYQGLMNRSIFTHGIVKKEVNDQVLAEADFLINIGNRTDYQLPSKIFDYLALNKPVINISSNENDSSWEFLSLSPLAINVMLNEDNAEDVAIRTRLEVFLKQPPDPLPDVEIGRLISNYLPQQIALEYTRTLLDH